MPMKDPSRRSRLLHHFAFVGMAAPTTPSSYADRWITPSRTFCLPRTPWAHGSATALRFGDYYQCR